MQTDEFLISLTKAEFHSVISFADAAAVPNDAVLVGRSQVGPGVGRIETMLCLDDKTTREGAASILVANANDAFFAAWPMWQQRPVPPDELFRRITLLVEDASPDSVLAVLILAARMAACDLQQILPAWLLTVRRWEAEGMVDSPEHDWASLAAALGHMDIENDPSSLSIGYLHAWQRVMRFTATCMLQADGPNGISDDPDWPLLAQARTALEQEYQTYQDWLPHAAIAQFSLPAKGADNRRLLVDGLIFNEDQPTGTAKIFYRNDKTASPLGHGFTFAASNRAGAPPGDDIALSLDTRRGVHLRELWVELERRECLAWAAAGEQRPNWSPRNVAKFGSWNQPWFINDGASLIGAPRTVALDPSPDAPLRPGSRLGWDDVQDAIWTVASPLQRIKVIDFLTGATVAIDKLSALRPAKLGGKAILIARWPKAAGQDRTVARAFGRGPGIERLLAAIIGHAGQEGAPRVSELSSRQDWLRVELSGGFALVTAGGVLLLDDWQFSKPLELERLRRVCVQSCGFDDDLIRLERDHIAPLAREINKHMAAGQLRREPKSSVLRAARTLVELAALRSNNVLLPADQDERRVQQALSQAWGLEPRLLAMERQVEVLSSSLKSLGDAQMRWISQFVAFVAFPFYVASGLANPVAKLTMGLLRRFDVTLIALPGAGTDPPSRLWWLCFLLMIAMFLILARLVSRTPAIHWADEAREE